jgi:hypothetical protein
MGEAPKEDVDPERPGQSLVNSIRRRFEPLGGMDLPEIPRGPMREPPRFEAVIALRPTNLHWLEGVDERYDVCAHSSVEFCIDGSDLITKEAGDFTVSAAALYLLRTLTRPHTKDGGPGQQLFPCCGNGLFEGEDGVVVFVGCNSGVDFDIAHDGDEVIITGADGREYFVGIAEWRAAVCRFSDLVQDSYASSAPKEPGEDAPEFQQFMNEWRRRRSLAQPE